MASRPDGDVWNIVDNDKDSQHYGRNFKFDFSYISSEEIKDVVKDYVWQNYRVGNKSLSSLYNEVKVCFFQFIRFTDTRNITSLKGLTNTDVDHFISYLHTTISERTQKPFGTNMQRNSLNALKSIIRWCQLHRPNDVPMIEIFTGNEYIGVNRKLKIDFIPDDVVAQINEALKTEKNPYLKYGIIILQSTGMRIGDLLKLRIDCIKPHLISGYTIEWTQHKGHKDKSPMPVRSECVAAIEKLIEITAELRDESDEKDKERAEVFQSVGVIGNINQIQSSAFDNVSEFEWFKANKDKCVAGLCDGYCTKPVTDGNICPRLLKRQKCYTCSRYITTPEYLEAHKQHLANLEKQLEEGAIYGEHYAEHFIPTIEVLKFIIERLEGLQNGN